MFLLQIIEIECMKWRRTWTKLALFSRKDWTQTLNRFWEKEDRMLFLFCIMSLWVFSTKWAVNLILFKDKFSNHHAVQCVKLCSQHTKTFTVSYSHFILSYISSLQTEIEINALNSGVMTDFPLKPSVCTPLRRLVLIKLLLLTTRLMGQLQAIA